MDAPAYKRAMLARVLAVTVTLGFTVPVELAVPIVRALAGRRGIQIGPALGSLVATVLTVAVLGPGGPPTGSRSDATARALTRDWDDDRVWVASSVALAGLGAALPVTVVGRRCSPLWGLGLVPLVRVVAAVALAAGFSQGKKRAAREITTAASTGAATPTSRNDSDCQVHPPASPTS